MIHFGLYGVTVLHGTFEHEENRKNKKPFKHKVRSVLNNNILHAATRYNAGRF